MMQTIADALKDQTVQDIYLAFAMAVLVLPMVALALWYHHNVNRTEGGRALMRVQERHRPVIGRLSQSQRNLRDAGDMAHDIASGVYGEDVRRLQRRT